MAAASQNLSSVVSPHPKRLPATRRGATVASGPSRFCAFSVGAPFEARLVRRRRRPQLAADRRFQLLVTFAVPQDSANDEIGGENGADELGKKAKESLEAWKELLESFKEEATKMRSVSQEAYDIYSQKALVILKEASENMKIQSDQARDDLSKLADVISQEGKQYLSTAARNSPESVKDIVETFASSPDELKDVSDVRDFYLGIPYGALLAVGGFLHFMLTGSLSGVRFGIILGGALLVFGVLSLRAWRSGQPSTLFLKGQAAIAGIIFIREWNLIFKFENIFMCFLTGAMLAFFVYRILIDGQNRDQSLKKAAPEN
ncbi:unnamed protein product [Spirodela intermedia]|uniref:Uncharacterized protein n=2 Tax=Spirodela intermedia TaxID=51605 RepID=A0A7I8IGE0_SPIIN|nr:unnamed protein product [Spirodela intermedia]CAA6656960.1 unnamed protein product [Spirodela intermedia]CAA7392937.1 unnamed protein product [Spirodela intermedia]